VNVAELAFEVSGVGAERLQGLDATRPELALSACCCAGVMMRHLIRLH